jgi:hypothetical protein
LAFTPAILALVLSGCANLSPDGCMGQIARLTAERTGSELVLGVSNAHHKQRMRELLAQPLKADGAEEIALRNNTAVHAAFAVVGIAEADYGQAARLRNPGLRINRLHDGDEMKFESVVGLDFVGLAARGSRTALEMARFEQARIRVVRRAVTLASEARRACFAPLAAQQKAAALLAFSQQANEADHQARLQALEGAWRDVGYGRERALRGELRAVVAKVEHRTLMAREELGR